MVTSNDINLVNSDLNNLIDEVVSSNPQLNNKIQKVKEESNLFICEILKFYTVKDKVQVRILSDNQVVTAHCTHDILSKDVSLKSMVKGVVNSDKNGATYIVPHSTIYGILAKVRYSGVTDEYCLISCVNFEDDFDLKSNVDSGEIRLTVGNSRLSVNDERINIMCPELFINGLPFSAPEFDNYHTVDDVNEIYNTLDESIKSVIVFGYYKDNNFYTTESYDEVIEKNNTKLFIDLATDTLYCVINDNYVSVGGGSSSNDYDVLVNKPCIDGVELNKESSSTGLGLATKYEVSNKQDKLIAGENISINDNVISASRGVTDYDTLTSKPSINNITLTGDKSSDELGLASKEHNHIIDDVDGLLSVLDSKADDSELNNYLNKEDIIDTGWLDLPLSSQFTKYDDGEHKPQYRAVGGIIFLRGAVKPVRALNQSSTGDFYLIGSLPSNYSTKGKTIIFAQHGYGMNLFQLDITDNNIRVGKYGYGNTLASSIPTTVMININCCYCIDDIVLGMINNIIGSVGDYNTLNNKPSINGNTLIGDTVLDIPSNLSDLNEDDTHKVVTNNQINYWNNKVETTELNNYTKTVDLDNLIATYGYLKTHQSLENYYTKSETNNIVSNATNDMATQTWVGEQGYLTSVPVLSVNSKIGNVVLTPSDLGLGSVFKIKGSKPTKNDLPTTNNEIGDVWYVIDESVGYIWLNDGTTTRWEQLGLEVDLSNYATITQLNNSLSHYVEKVTGKELSSNDFTDSLKNKLEGLNNYDDTDLRLLLNEKANINHNQQDSTIKVTTQNYGDINQDTFNSYLSYDMLQVKSNKQDKLVSGTNLKTINNESLLGSGNITIQGGESTSDYDFKHGDISLTTDTTSINQGETIDCLSVLNIKNNIEPPLKLPLANASVDIIDSNNDIIGSNTTDTNGNCVINISPLESTTIYARFSHNIYSNALSLGIPIEVIGEGIIFYDTCSSADKLTHYNIFKLLDGVGVTSLEYNSVENAYEIKPVTDNPDSWCGYIIKDMQNIESYQLTLEFKSKVPTTYYAYNQLLIGVAITDSHEFIGNRIRSDNLWEEFVVYGGSEYENTNYINTHRFSDQYYKLTMIKEEEMLYYQLYDSQDMELGEFSTFIPYSYEYNVFLGVQMRNNSNRNFGFYIKNIKIESI